MEKGKKVKYGKTKGSEADAVREATAPYLVEKSKPGPMVRTQIYLSQAEYDFVQTEANRNRQPMAAVIRSLIDQRMKLPDDAWTNNPMLEPTIEDRSVEDHEDGAINHDHYIYGSPKKWVKVDGEWVEAPPLPEDYYENSESTKAYDEAVSKQY